MKRKNKLVYALSLIVIIIIFLVIYLFGNGFEKIVYTDNIDKQPINNIRNIIKEEEPKDDDNKKDNNKNNGKNNNQGNSKDNEQKEEENIVKPNTDSPIKFVYNEDVTKGNYIYLVNQFPIKDEVGKKLSGEYKTFDFKLEFNEGSLGASYDVTLEKMKDSDLENNWIKVYLESDGNALNESIRSTGRIKTFDNYSAYSNKENEIILYQGKVTNQDLAKGYKNFTLRMWISEDVNVVNEEYTSKTIVARVNVHAIGN